MGETKGYCRPCRRWVDRAEMSAFNTNRSETTGKSPNDEWRYRVRLCPDCSREFAELLRLLAWDPNTMEYRT